MILRNPFDEEVPDPYTGKILEGEARDRAVLPVQMLSDKEPDK